MAKQRKQAEKTSVKASASVDADKTWPSSEAANTASKSRSSLKCLIIISSSVLLPALIIGAFMYNVDHIQRLEPVKYADVIKGAPAHKWSYFDEFFSTESKELMRRLALSGATSFTTINDNGEVGSAGEAVPAGHVDCRHPFMTLNLNRTMCHFSNRLDVGMHFVKTGGFNGHIEYYDRMVARIIPFRKRLLSSSSSISQQQQEKEEEEAASHVDLKSLPEFTKEPFLSTVRSICADSVGSFKGGVKSESIVTEMFQLDLLLMLPGQELPIHLNTPYFWGADRSSFPQWLLVAMKNSKLFDHLFIPQVQGLSPLLLEDVVNSEPTEADRKQEGFVEINGQGGDFFFYPYKPIPVKSDVEKPETYSDENLSKFVILKSIENSVIILDGAQVMHGVDRYRPTDLPPLFASVNHHYTLRLDPSSASSSETWLLFDFENNLLRRYSSSELKLLVAWNVHCFGSEAERTRFHSTEDATRRQLTIEHVIDVFKRDLKARDRLPSDSLEPLELWTIVLKEYLRYPTNRHQQNSTIFGLNYCLLPNLAPEWLSNNFLKPYLATRC